MTIWLNEKVSRFVWLLLSFYNIVAVQSPSHDRFFMIQWTAAQQASLTPTPSTIDCPSSWSLHLWSHLTISSSVTLSSFCLQSFPESWPFPISRLFVSGGQSIEASASASASGLPMDIQDWFPLRFTGLISLLSKVLSRVFSAPQFKNTNSSLQH